MTYRENIEAETLLGRMVGIIAATNYLERKRGCMNVFTRLADHYRLDKSILRVSYMLPYSSSFYGMVQRLTAGMNVQGV